MGEIHELFFLALSLVWIAGATPEITQKSLMSVIFPAVILGPEMAAPILCAPGIFWFFLLETPHAQKIPRFRGVSWVFWRGGVEVPTVFLRVWGFFRKIVQKKGRCV